MMRMLRSHTQLATLLDNGVRGGNDGGDDDDGLDGDDDDDGVDGGDNGSVDAEVAVIKLCGQVKVGFEGQEKRRYKP